MNAFDTRLKNNLFPEMPASFSNRVQKALKTAGVEQKSARPLWIAATAVAAVAAAASLLLVVTNAIRDGGRQNELAPVDTPQTGIETSVPHSSMGPDWNWNTSILSAVNKEAQYTDADVEHYGRAILSFLHELGESEPEELWILCVRSTENFLPANDTGSYVKCELVLAQSSFEPTDGPNLYCIQKHADGEVLWGTIDGSAGPHRVLAKAYGQQRWFFFGSNTNAAGESLGHVSAGYLTGGEPGTDVEFGASLSTDEAREPFKISRHFQQLREYYLVTDGSADLDDAPDLSLLLVTEHSNYAYPIRTGVPELTVITAEEASGLHQHLETIAAQTAKPYDGTNVKNLTVQSDGIAASYADAILAWLKQGGIEPKDLWICGAAPFAYAEENPTDEAYVLAQYTFDGEAGPELFYCQNGTIRWQTNGYDPFRLNTVYDPIRQQNCVFGASPFFDNGPVPVKDAEITYGTAEWSQTNGFSVELPLHEVQTRLAGEHAEWAGEFFLCPYPKETSILSLTFTAHSGETYAPALDTVNTLIASVAPCGVTGS